MNRKIRILIQILLVVILTLSISGAHVALASPAATATLKFDARSLMVEIRSPVGISDAQIKLDILTALTITSHSTTGFMSNATHLAQGTEHRWFVLSSNEQTSGSLYYLWQSLKIKPI